MERADPKAGIVGGGVITEDSRIHDLEQRIAERAEQLYRLRMVGRLLTAWAYPGNLVLVAVVASVLLLGGQPWGVDLGLVLVAIASVATSLRLVYKQHFTIRAVRTELRELHRRYREGWLDELDSGDLLGAHKRYRAHLPEVIDSYRIEARKHRWKSHSLQCVIIVGSILTGVVAAASVSVVDARWAAVVISVLVAVSASLSAYGKFQERGTDLVRAADALEREYESVELRVGRYRKFAGEREAYAEFADTVETLRVERVGGAETRDAFGL